MKGTFNQGWWNCFESFTNEFMSVYNDGRIPMAVLKSAGITEKEAQRELGKLLDNIGYNGIMDMINLLYCYLEEIN